MVPQHSLAKGSAARATETICWRRAQLVARRSTPLEEVELAVAGAEDEDEAPPIEADLIFFHLARSFDFYETSKLAPNLRLSIGGRVVLTSSCGAPRFASL